MKVKYRTCMAGSRFTRNVGDVADVGREEAERLIAAGFAEKFETEDDKGDGEKKDGGKGKK